MNSQTVKPKIPLVDLKKQYHSIREEIDQKIAEVLESGQFIDGPNLTAFEKEFADYCGTRFAVGVASGADALTLCLKALGVTTGDEVITVPNTFTATADAISHSGALPSFVDVEPNNYNLKISDVPIKISRRTKAILPVHLYGQTIDFDALRETADQYGFPIVEDACQAHGAEYNGKKAGSLGKCACFSFYPAKNLGAYGDGGMVVTNDEELANHVRMLRNYGQPKKYDHVIIGYNSRLDELQAAILRVKLSHLDGWVDQRRKAAKIYSDLLSGTFEKIITPVEMPYAKHAYYLYVIRSKARDSLRAWLANHGISTGIHYPVPVHLQKSYSHLGLHSGMFPTSELLCNEVLSLPLFPELTIDEIEYVCQKVRLFAE